MDFNNNYPIYKQLSDIFIKDIVNNIIKPGDKMISIRDAAIKYKLNPNTIINSFKELENKNILITKRGLGSYITEDDNIINSLKLEYINSIIDDFLEKMNNLGFNNEKIINIILERNKYE